MRTISTILLFILITSCSGKLTFSDSGEIKTFKVKKHITVTNDRLSFETKKGTKQSISLEYLSILSEKNPIIKEQRIREFIAKETTKQKTIELVSFNKD